jgi:hypothetical protein
MKELTHSTPKNPNPQGKGCVPVLQDWAGARPQLPIRKSTAEILRDYCLSGLVLAATFRFRPVPGKHYFLYCNESDWMLSLVAPQEWGTAAPGDFVADCQLQTDMTWQLDFAPKGGGHRARERLQQFVEGFADMLAEQESPEDALPFYVPELPYFQRMLATGLAVSLQHSIRDAGPNSLAAALPTLSLTMGRS